jgi:outer membrane protein
MPLWAQTTQPKQWTLQECISYALENNISIKRQKLNADYQSNQLKTSKLDMIPSVNAATEYGIGFGRSLNKTMNAYNSKTTQSVNGGISTDVTLFQGFVKKNSIKEARYNLLAATESVKEIQNNIALSLTSYYLQVLFDKELLSVAREQYELTNQQLERSKKLVDAGKTPMGTLLEIKSQLAKEALNITNQENSLSLSLLNLAQVLDLADVNSFDVVSPQIPEIGTDSVRNVNDIFETAVNTMPQIKGAEFDLLSSNYQLKKAKGNMLPTLSLGAGWNTQDSKVKGEFDFDFKNSLKNNANTYINLKLSVPIFNGLQARYGVKNAQIKQLDYQYALDAKKLALRKEIQQAYADATAAYKKYLSSHEAVTSYNESFSYTEKKFDVGIITTIDYNTAKNELTKSQSDLLQSKYEYILRCKILDFYKGIPIQL